MKELSTRVFVGEPDSVKRRERRASATLLLVFYQLTRPIMDTNWLPRTQECVKFVN